MWSILVNNALRFVFTLLVRAVGWWITHWIAGPIRKFEEIRWDARVN